MKRTGGHPRDELSAIKVRNLATPGRYPDGNGLYLLVDKNGAKRWILRIVVKGARKDIGLGSVRLVGLAEARQEATRLRKIAREGGDPLAERKRERAEETTFDDAAKKAHAYYAATLDWKNPKHADQWINTLTTYASPAFGTTRVGEIDAPIIVKALRPIWGAKPETARRVLQRTGAVIDWAKGEGMFRGDNPVNEARTLLGKQNIAKSHFEAMPYQDVPAFYRRIPSLTAEPATKLALQLLILCTSRSSEVTKASADEFDLDNAVWTIPGSRMKAKVEHRVPLTDAAVEVVRQALALPHTADLLFPGSKPDKPMSDMTLLRVLRREGLACTIHGFRSAFKDWATEETGYPDELSEQALAHAEKDKTKKAYKRGDLFKRRRALMTAWSEYLTKGSKVVALRSAR